MDVFYQPKAVKALEKRIADIKGRGAQRFAETISKILVEGNEYDRLNARTKDGGSIQPLRSKRKGKYKGASGPPLAPFGAQSRVVTAFKAKVKRTQGNGMQVVAGWSDVVSKSGVPFLPFHDAGAGRLPRRPIFGISPKTRAEIRRVHKQWVDGLFNQRGYRGD